MDAVVLLIFAAFFTAMVVSATAGSGLLRGSVRRPGLFQVVAVLAAAATVPVDLYAVIYGTAGPGGAVLADVTGRLLLLNVAASCGAAALHEFLRVSPADDTTDTEPPLRMGVLGWIGPLVALAAVTAIVALGSVRNEPELGNVGSVWACYALLICLMSAYALLRRRAGDAVDPREG
jgi:hypothetical protein